MVKDTKLYLFVSDVIFLENPRDRKTSQNNSLGTILNIN